MKFRGIKTFLRQNETTNYMLTEFNMMIVDLFQGLKRLSFADNFDSFTADMTLPAGTEVFKSNQLVSGKPTKYIVLRNSAGQPIGDGPTEWTDNTVYLKNYGTLDTTITVVFMR